ncbi:hypothetical protein HBO11_28250 [Pseudomonas sp. WS 5010]|uniref:hypothetical protein n=1 Tax=Pseudomonas sp. WS 5010 TaxID=2717489 RepID=UPI0014754B1C|nr:hypothetical protein [Pseudomonas sp. WS 5010]NMX89457.1 hypothetical protein [Pseudomonas sp. WS 5010]
MSGIELDFQAVPTLFDFAPDVLADHAMCKSAYASAYMDYLKAHAFGNVHVHSKFVAANLLKTEKISAFYDKQYLYVIRTLDDDSKVFRFYAPTELRFVDAVKIVELHQQMSTLDLQDHY